MANKRTNHVMIPPASLKTSRRQVLGNLADPAPNLSSQPLSEAAAKMAKVASAPAAASHLTPVLPLSSQKSETRAAADELPAPHLIQTLDVTFALEAPQAKQVSLCGEFNDWSPEATPMRRQSAGRWEATVALGPGRYQYKFVVDGQWLHDPEARDYLPNPHGSMNSIKDVRA